MKWISTGILAAVLAAGCIGCNSPVADEPQTDPGRRVRLLQEENHRKSVTIAECQERVASLNERIEQLEAEITQIQEASTEATIFLMDLVIQKEAELSRCRQQLEEAGLQPLQ
jgi:uncharacterized small protein (DUF1192 family)